MFDLCHFRFSQKNWLQVCQNKRLCKQKLTISVRFFRCQSWMLFLIPRIFDGSLGLKFGLKKYLQNIYTKHQSFNIFQCFFFIFLIFSSGQKNYHASRKMPKKDLSSILKLLHNLPSDRWVQKQFSNCELSLEVFVSLLIWRKMFVKHKEALHKSAENKNCLTKAKKPCVESHLSFDGSFEEKNLPKNIKSNVWKNGRKFKERNLAMIPQITLNCLLQSCH